MNFFSEWECTGHQDILLAKSWVPSVVSTGFSIHVCLGPHVQHFCIGASIHVHLTPCLALSSLYAVATSLNF